MSMNPRTLRPSSTFSPRSISGLALWLDASDSSRVVLNAGNVSQIADKSGNNRNATQATAARQPLYQAALQNGRNGVRNDKAESFLQFDSPLGTAMTLFYAGKPSTQSNSYILGGNTSDTGILSRFNNGGTIRDYEWWNGGGSDRLIIATSQAGFSVIGLTHQDEGPIFTYVNGAQTNTKGTASATITGTSLKILGAANTAGSAPANNEYGEFLLYNRVLTTTERQRLERYLAARWGITLAPQAANADAQNWIDRVYQNGGTVSSATAAAVNTFCDAIASAGIRDRFYRLNLFCGSNLNSALVPLYRGPSLGGTQYGGATDTNVGGLFVSGDYNETVGLTPSGGVDANSTKYLNTGFSPSDIADTGTGHISAWKAAGAAGPFSTPALMGADAAGGVHRLTLVASTSHLEVAFATSVSLQSAVAYTGNGLVFHTRRSSSDAELYFNGSSVAVDNTARAYSGNTTDIAIFNRLQSNNTVFNSVGFFHPLLCYSVGASMTFSQQEAYYNALRAMFTSIGRTIT